MTSDEKKNKATLQKILAAWFSRKKEPGPFPATAKIFDDGRVEFYVGEDLKATRKLSEAGKEYIRTDGLLLREQEEDFLEPELGAGDRT